MNTLKKIRQFFEYLVFLLVYIFISIFPLNIASKIIGTLMVFISVFLRRKDRVKKQLIQYMNYDGANTPPTIRKIYYHFGQNIGEMMMMKSFIKRQKLFDFPKIPKANKIGNIYVTAHFSNWEMVGLPFYFENKKAAFVYRHISNPYIDKFILKRRSLIYRGGCYEKFETSSNELENLLLEGIDVVILCDQKWLKGIKLEFLGHETTSMVIPAVLSLRTGANIHMLKVNRGINSQYKFELEKLNYTKNKDNDITILNIMTNIHNIYSRWIKSNPSEWWLWTHEKWKSE
ncbi:MAG: lysophospholipid acyltransferase family protein [Hyphomicrobiales bacterium]